MTGCRTCGGFGMRHDPIAHGAEPEERKTALAFCALCDGTGSFPDADHPCDNCCGIGEVVYVPVDVRRKS